MAGDIYITRTQFMITKAAVAYAILKKQRDKM